MKSDVTRRGILALAVVLTVVAVAVSGTVHRAAAAPLFAGDPIVGDWTTSVNGVTETVTISPSGAQFNVVLTTVLVVSSSCVVSPGTLVANFGSTGGSGYSGTVANWDPANCPYGGVPFTLGLNGDTLNALINGTYPVTFTRSSLAVPTPTTTPTLPATPTATTGTMKLFLPRIDDSTSTGPLITPTGRSA